MREHRHISRERFDVWGVAVAAMLLLAARSVAGEDRLPTSLPADEVEIRQAIVYSTSGKNPLRLDLARPRQRAGSLPVVVCIHGGGWITGGRQSTFDPYAKYLAAYGYVAVSPSYRLAPAHPFPAAVADVRNCVRWLRRQAVELGIDDMRIGAMGLSAGGHLALMLGVASDEDRFGPEDEPQAKESARVQAVVNYFGPTDLGANDWPDGVVDKYLTPFLEGTPEEKPEAYRRASPITYAGRGDPPVLTFHGRLDNVVPFSQARLLHQQLEKVGVVNELVAIDRQGHGWGEPHLRRTCEQMVRFFDRYLKNAEKR